MAKYVPKITEPILNYTPDKQVENIVSFAGKAIRAKIIADRYTRGFKKADRKGPRDAYDQGERGVDQVPAHRQTMPGREPAEGYTHETPGRLSRADIGKDYISIVDIDYNQGKHEDSRHYSYVQLPFVPRELNYVPESKFVGIASFGTNNPIYQFTGSEDTLSFEIDWFSDQDNRRDVIFNCRWLEALTKSDAYQEAPHRVKIVWGGQQTGDNEWEDPQGLWEDSVWVLVSAPYRLSQFNRGYMKDGNYVSTHMLPQQAYQTVVFKRVTNYNRSTADIIGNIIR